MIIVAGSDGSGGGAVITAQAAEALAPGVIVYADNTGQWRLALASNATATRAYGFATAVVGVGFAGPALNAGQLELTTAEWDAVTGEVGGLTPGSQYFLSSVTAGEITKTPVASGYRVPVGKSITATRMAVQVDECVKLAV